MQEFLDAIRRAQQSGTRDFFDCLFLFFNRIAHFSREEVTAAWQAFSYFRYYVATKEERTQHDKLFERIHDTLLARMVSLCCDQEESSRANLAQMFSRLTKHTWNFKEFLPAKQEREAESV